MQRLKDWTVEGLNDEQKQVHDEIVNGPRGRVVGPLRIWLNNPKISDEINSRFKMAKNITKNM